MPAAPEILQAIADGEIDQAFVLAKAYVQAEAPGMKTQLATIESVYKLSKSELNKGKISFGDFSLHHARAADALCQMFAPASEKAPTLQSGYHALTCDRETQTAHFEQLFIKRRTAGEQIQFYYLYGGRYQSHESLSKRLVHERGGMRRGLALAPTAKVGLGSVQFDVCEDIECSKVEFITRLCEAFSINPNAYVDLKSKRLDFILQESSVLRGLRSADFALCYIEVSDWDNQLVPTVGEWFVKEFCESTLRDDAPTCLFFFGVNYRETDERTPREIEVALRSAQHIDGLPELTMIEEANLEDWIRHYSKPLGLANISARDALFDEVLAKVRIKHQSSPRKHVPGKDHLLHMDDVEMELKRVIDEKNE
ncbi:MAG: hypothetical protein H7246_07230 [Phycisphaerae bacterium]|nr:hypothetical protein [Saprospiraceae bacterium]